jgi:hypothetical protein
VNSPARCLTYLTDQFNYGLLILYQPLGGTRTDAPGFNVGWAQWAAICVSFITGRHLI